MDHMAEFPPEKINPSLVDQDVNKSKPEFNCHPVLVYCKSNYLLQDNDLCLANCFIPKNRQGLNELLF